MTVKKSRIIAVLLCVFSVFLACGKESPTTNPAPAKKGAAGPVPMYVGVNLDGAQFGGNAYPGKEGTDYIWPNTQEVDYFASKGANTIRIGFTWERLQPTLNGNFVSPYNDKLIALTNYIAGKNINVILNPHNFARYRLNGTDYLVGSSQVPSSAFTDLWMRLANQFKGNTRIIFGLVNEPHDIPAGQWLFAANNAIVGIRWTGAKNLISVPMDGWTGVRSWFDKWTDVPGNSISNSQSALQITDSGNNFMFEMHHYFDEDAGGGYNNNECSNNGTQELIPVINWLRTNGKKAIIAEYGTPNTTKCKGIVTEYLTLIQSNSDVIKGNLFWSSGPWWGSYKLTIEPKNLGTANVIDDPKLAWLTPFWQQASNPNPNPVIPPVLNCPPPVVCPACPSCPTCPACPNCPACPDTGVIADSGVADAGTPDAALPNPSATIAFRTKWSNGYCVDVSVKNSSTKSVAFHETSINLNGGKMRDFWDIRMPSNKWGDAGPILFKPLTINQWIAAGAIQKFGFCEDNIDPNKLAIVVYVN